MKIRQTLKSGISIDQDFRDCVRFVMFETEDKTWRYATHGGTAFVANFQNHFFGLTCKHVLGDFNWRQLALTNTKFGELVAGLSSICYPSNPTEAAKGSDIADIAVLQFSDDVDASFFKDCAYVIDDGTVSSSSPGDNLVVNGALKDNSTIDEDNITPAFCRLELGDVGPSKNDPVLRAASGKFKEPRFNSLAGLSGSPVFNATMHRLCGMVVRGGLDEELATIWYIEIQDIIEILKAILDGSMQTKYAKSMAHPRLIN